MKSPITPINLAVDASALLVSMFAWAFLVWTPVILAIAIFGVAKIPYPASIQIFIFITAIFLPCGILLKWLGNGIIKRKRTQMGFSSILLGFIGFGIMLVSFASRTRLGARIFERFGTGSIILTAAVVVGIGLIERSRISGE